MTGILISAGMAIAAIFLAFFKGVRSEKVRNKLDVAERKIKTTETVKGLVKDAKKTDDSDLPGRITKRR